MHAADMWVQKGLPKYFSQASPVGRGISNAASSNLPLLQIIAPLLRVLHRIHTESHIVHR